MKDLLSHLKKVESSQTKRQQKENDGGVQGIMSEKWGRWFENDFQTQEKIYSFSEDWRRHKYARLTHLEWIMNGT
jgi:hypothetical protein